MSSLVRLITRVALVAVALGAAACGSSGTPTAPSAPGTPQPSSTPPPPTAGASETARYRLVFEATWSASTHPHDFPSSAHFSSLIGGTHGPTAVFWQEGAPASQGIRNMAELGRTGPLDSEIGAAVQAGTAERVVTGGGLGSSPGSVSLEFEISQRYPLVTFVSMIAPSPDWFVGVAGLPLVENGQWIGERQIDLVPWDAGTDSGTTFTSGDRDTQPRAAIRRITTAPLAPGGTVRPLGRFTFTRVS